MKCAIITGGSRGIGRAICEKLAVDSPYHILINYQSNEQAAQETLESVQRLGGTGQLLRFDVTDKEQTERVLSQWQGANKEAQVEVMSIMQELPEMGYLCGCLTRSGIKC